MRTSTITGLATAAVLAAFTMPAGALPVEPSAIAKANTETSNVVDVQWRRHHWRHRYWGPRYGYGGPRYYPYRSYGYDPYYYRSAPSLSIGPRGFRFGVW